MMIEHFEFESHGSAASIVEQYGDTAPAIVTAEAVGRLEMQDFDAYVTLKQILKDVEVLLAERETPQNG